VPYDVESRVRVLQERQAAKIEAGQQAMAGLADVAAKDVPAAGPRPAGAGQPGEQNGQGSPPAAGDGSRSSQAPDIAPIGSLTRPGRAIVEGRVTVVEIRPVERNSVLACEISDGTGVLTALFYGRSHIPGIVCGARVRFRGSVGIGAGGQPVMINPAYELLFPAV
jgi:hypothetical protein